MWHSKFKFLCILHIFQLIATIYSKDIVMSNGYRRSLRKEHDNRFISMQAACTRNVIMVVTTLRDPFNGLIYAKGYPDDCWIPGNGTREVKLAMNVSNCGVRIFEEMDGKLVYELHVYIQFDRIVQQVTDEQVLVSCSPVDFISVSSQGRSAGSHLKHLSDSDWRNHQTGRKAPKALPIGTAVAFDEVSSVPQTINTWMDIVSGKTINGKIFRDYLRVGEEATMMVKIYQQPGLTTRVVSCFAHDGSGDIQQELIDENGCAVDNTIMPNLRERNSRTGLKVVYAPFAAFKFPDKDNLHLKCQVMVCIRYCPPLFPCVTREGRHYQRSQHSATIAADVIERDKYLLTNNDGSVVDIIDVFNAFEVRAPQIELDAIALDHLKSDVTKTRHLEENTTCLATSKMILSFGILTGIAVISVVFSISMYVLGRQYRRIGRKCIHLSNHRPYESYS